MSDKEPPPRADHSAQSSLAGEDATSTHEPVRMRARNVNEASSNRWLQASSTVSQLVLEVPLRQALPDG